MTGGAGSDRFEVYYSNQPLTRSGADLILDWSPEDRLTANGGGKGMYVEFTATDFASGLAAAQARQAPLADFLQPNAFAVEIGGDVVVFSAFGGGIRNAVVLAGRTLSDISEDNWG